MTFAPGETTKTITIEVKGDSKKEANETFYLDLFGNSSNTLFTKDRGLGTILTISQRRRLGPAIVVCRGRGCVKLTGARQLILVPLLQREEACR
ncbi:MAG: hypothetical protein L0215_02145 [Gemmataceae bacterium]|nr:hypothetical protein [Gemmataceae bacterium]